MSDKIDFFLTEVRNMPKFVAASASDPKWLKHFEGIERGLRSIDRLADGDPAILEIYDKIQAAVGRTDLSLKQRLLEVGRLATQVRDGNRKVN